MEYTIKIDDEVEILGKNLRFATILNLSGCQVNNKKNTNVIKDKCEQIAILIKEIEKLNIK